MQQPSTPAQTLNYLPPILEDRESGSSSEGLASHVSGSSLEVASPRGDRRSSSFSFRGALRNIANRLACGARASSSANPSNSERSESPRSVQSRSSSVDQLTEPAVSELSSQESLSTVEHQPESLVQFHKEAYGRTDRKPERVGLTNAGKAFDIFLKETLVGVNNPQSEQINQAALYLLYNTDRVAIHAPGLQEAFQHDRGYLHNAYGDQFTGEQIEHAIQNNVRLWIRANLVDYNTEDRHTERKTFFTQIFLDLQDTQSELTGPGGTIPSPGELPEALESVASEAGQEFDLEGSDDDLTRSASFDSISFGTGGAPRAIIADEPTSAPTWEDPGHIPRNLLASDAKPEMYSFWCLLGDIVGPVADAPLNEKNIASFNILRDQGHSEYIPQLQQAFQQDRQNLHLHFNGGFDGGKIDHAICQHIQSWLKANLMDHPLPIKQELLTHFMGEVSDSLLGSLDQGSIQDGTGSEFSANDEPVLCGTTSTPSVSSDGWGDEVLRSSNLQPHSRLEDLLPKVNPGSLFGHRNSESSRLAEVAKSFSWFTETLLGKSRLGSVVGQSPVVDVSVINRLRVGRRSLGVQFATNMHQELVDNNAANVVQTALNPDATASGFNPLDTMFLAQLENSGINKHQYHKALRQDAKQSGNVFRLSSQTYGGLVPKALPMLGLKKSLEQKVLNRLNVQGGKNLSAMTDASRHFSKAGDKAFLTYMANQQALWKQIKPDQSVTNRLFDAHENGQRVHFHLLDQIGFNEKGLNPDQLIQLGKLVMSAVGAAVVRSPLADSDIATLYRTGFGDTNVPMPMNASQFRAALGPGRLFLTSERRFGTLGSQVIDLMASLNAKRRIFINPREHQMLGNLLTLMMMRQSRYQEQTAAQEPAASKASLRNAFMNGLVIDTKRTLVPALRPYMKNDFCMKAVLDAVGQSIQKGMFEAAKQGTAPDAVFFDRFKAAVRQDGDLLAMIRNGLIDQQAPASGLAGEIEPQASPEDRQKFLGQLMDQVADTAHHYADVHAAQQAEIATRLTSR